MKAHIFLSILVLISINYIDAMEPLDINVVNAFIVTRTMPYAQNAFGKGDATAHATVHITLSPGMLGGVGSAYGNVLDEYNALGKTLPADFSWHRLTSRTHGSALPLMDCGVAYAFQTVYDRDDLSLFEEQK